MAKRTKTTITDMNGKRSLITYAAVTAVIYISLFIWSAEFPLFWDNPQQIGAEGNWFYANGHSTIIEPAGVGTGYHIPFLPYVTSAIWMVTGRSVVISHVLALAAAALLIVGTWGIVKRLTSGMASAVVGLLLVTEPTVVTQFCEASPDFIMLALLASGLSALASGRYALTGFALLGMGLMNMRGVMAAVFLGSVMCIARYRDGGLTWRMMAKLALPSVVVFGAYYATYFAVNGWFFGESSNYSEHYAQPTSVAYVAKHVASLILRMLEQGRIIIWAGAAWLVLRYWSEGKDWLAEHSDGRVALGFTMSQILLFGAFAFISQMPFGGRYFMMSHYALSLVVLSLACALFRRKATVVFFVIAALAQVTGHAWEAFYPEKMSKPWDTTLLHTAYYGLREEVVADIQEMNIETSDIAAGFVWGKDPLASELNADAAYFCGPDSARYRLLSNIDNDEDEVADSIATYGHEIKRWRRGAINASLYDMRSVETTRK